VGVQKNPLTWAKPVSGLGWNKYGQSHPANFHDDMVRFNLLNAPVQRGNHCSSVFKFYLLSRRFIPKMIFRIFVGDDAANQNLILFSGIISWNLNWA
jgi:hypothetical protein